MLAEKQPPSWPHGPGAAAHALQNSSSVVLKNPTFFFNPLFSRRVSLHSCQGVFLGLKPVTCVACFSAIHQPVRSLIRSRFCPGEMVACHEVQPGNFSKSSARVGWAVGGGGRSLRVTLWKQLSVEYACTETVMLKTSLLNRRRTQQNSDFALFSS